MAAGDLGLTNEFMMGASGSVVSMNGEQDARGVGGHAVEVASSSFNVLRASFLLAKDARMHTGDSPTRSLLDWICSSSEAAPAPERLTIS